MKLSNDEPWAINVVIISISIFVWILLLLNPGHIAHCHVSDMGASSASLKMMLMMNPITGLMTGWALMIIAMMFPKLILSVQYIYERSLKSHRLASSLLFVFGYTIVWMAAGIFIIAIQLASKLFMPDSYLPLVVFGLLMSIWHISPAKQYCLNKGHDHPALAAFGWPASRDALKFGANHGLWCVASGWPLMLFPMLLIEGHQLAMIFVTFVMLSEHIEHPQTPCWRLALPTKLIKMLWAQSKINMKRKLQVIQ